MLEQEMERRFSRFVSVSSASLFNHRDVIKEARRSNFVQTCHGENCYVIRFRDSVVPAGPYTAAALHASERENGQHVSKAKRYLGHRIRIKYHLSNHDFIYVGVVENQDGNALTLIDVVDYRDNKPRQIDDNQCFVFEIKPETEIEILD